jgi:hypothetical protein
VHLGHCSSDSAAEFGHGESTDGSAGAAELNDRMTGSAKNCIVAGTCVAARLPLGLKLAFLLSKFSTLAFKTDSLV